MADILALIKQKLINETFAIIIDLFILYFVLASNTLMANLLQRNINYQGRINKFGNKRYSRAAWIYKLAIRNFRNVEVLLAVTYFMGYHTNSGYSLLF